MPEDKLWQCFKQQLLQPLGVVFGKAIGKRFEILSKVFEGDFGYVYEDLEEKSQPTGTRVRLTIPLRHTY